MLSGGYPTFLGEILHETGLGDQLPAIDPDLVTAALREHYGIAGELERIATEKDDTFRLRHAVRLAPDHPAGNADLPSEDFLVKCSPSSEPSDIVNLQTATMVYLEHHHPDIPAQRVIPTLSGHREVDVEVGVPHSRVLRVLTFLPGSLLAKTDPTPGQWRLTGQMLGRLTHAMAGFMHPRQDRRLLWDMAHFHRLAELIDFIGDPEHRRLARRIFQAYNDVVTPALPRLRRQVIHGDFSPFNAIADPDDPHFITGIIDFGDTVYTCALFDPAVAMANVIGTDSAAPWGAAEEVLQGYRTTNPIPAEDTILLREIALGRLLLRAMVVYWRAATDSERHAYLLGHSELDWQHLEAAYASPADQVRSRLLATT